MLPSLPRCTRNKEQQKNSRYLYLARKAAVKTERQQAWKCQRVGLNEAETASTEEQSQCRAASIIDREETGGDRKKEKEEDREGQRVHYT